MTDDLQSPEQVAARFSVSRSTVYHWIKTGQLRALRIGGRWRIPRDAVQAFEQGAEYTPPADAPAGKAKRRKPTK